MDPNIQKPSPNTLLAVADHHLRRRNYSDCRKYALQLPSHFTGADEILAVADVLLATTTSTNWYDVIQVPRFSNDNELITQQFNKLYKLLNPSVNKFVYADEALSSLFKAWNVLSNRVKKMEFDEELRGVLGLGDDEVFWTVCPYCWYVYEYDRVYLGCFMKCCNEKCGRAFTCVEIDKPSDEVLSEGGGRYLCKGFLMVGVREGEWNPFLPKVSGAKVSETEFVELSDDDDDDNHDFDDVEVEEKVEVKKEEEKEDVPVKKTEKRRKKSVAKKTKKVTGAGNRVTREEFMREETEMDTFGYGARRMVNVEYF